tara:strand:- start:5890 stop:6249 length:360 start_codon:yes stop_codon:yes gene_type:complete
MVDVEETCFIHLLLSLQDPGVVVLPERVLPIGLSNVSPHCHSFHQLERPFERVQNVIVELLNGSLLTVSRLIEHKIDGRSHTLLITESWVEGLRSFASVRLRPDRSQDHMTDEWLSLVE